MANAADAADAADHAPAGSAMSVDVGSTAVIERSIGDVAAFAGDPTNAPAWHRLVDTAEWVTDPPVRLGSRVHVAGRLAGRPIGATFEIVELTPGEQIALRTIDGPLPMRTIWTWRPVGGRVTHMTVRHRVTPSGPRRLLGPLIARILRRATRNDLATLKRLLEP